MQKENFDPPIQGEKTITPHGLQRRNLLKLFGGSMAVVTVAAACKKNDTRTIYECYITLGNTLNGLNNSEKALEYYNKAFTLLDRLKNDSQYLQLKAQTYSFIGNVYKKDKEFQKAISYFEKASRYSTFVCKL